MKFYKSLEEILQTQDPHEKIEKFNEFYQNYKEGLVKFEEGFKAKIFKTPSFANICKVVPATVMKKRSSLSTDRGLAYLLHSIAHIEYSAIDLALEHAYRFESLPKEYYNDWLKVADDEIRHFLMVEKNLSYLGYRYGDFEVHSFLFDISQRSLDLLSRMATIPRYLEASGLDSSPKVIEKLKCSNHPYSGKAIASLLIILDEEIDHVKKGDKWFRYACEKEGVDPKEYFSIVEKQLPGASKKKPFVNVSARKKAGFSCDEIRTLGDVECE
jgi:uncharacterized ferritin-like protein (DUF455 family)